MSLSASDRIRASTSQSGNRFGAVIPGFAGLLLLIAVLAFDSATRVRDVTLDSANLRRHYRERSAVWDQLRADIYHASTLFRHQLAEPTSAASLNRESAVAELKLHSYQLLRQYEQLVPEGERRNYLY